MKKMSFGWAGLVVILLATAAWTFPRHPVPKEPIDTLIQGWEQKFSIDYSVAPGPHHTTRIEGYVINHSGDDVDEMRVLAQEFDTSGAVVGKQITWVLGGVNADGRAYFVIDDVTPAASYRITVWDYDTVEAS